MIVFFFQDLASWSRLPYWTTISWKIWNSRRSGRLSIACILLHFQLVR